VKPGNERSHQVAGEPDSVWFRRLHAVDRFEERWQTCGDASIADFLPVEPTEERRDLLCELIKIDLEYRWGRDQRTQVEEYVARFPELGDSATIPLDLIVEEFRVRAWHGSPPSDDELAGRFPTRVAELSAAVKSGGPKGYPARLSGDSRSLSRSDTVQTAPLTDPTGVKPRHSLAYGMPSVPGVLGRYEVRQLVGRGGFATVWRAFDPVLRREVAIKVPRPELFEVPGFHARIEREVQAAARLRHPAIVPIYEVAESDQAGRGGSTFIVYEFVAGPTLAKWVEQTKPSQRQAAEWIARLAEALDYAHENGIVHRDIKPANVMMNEHGQPMLADFGLALQADAGATLTQQGDILGTPAYMSPEQARGEGHRVDARTDVYGLGVMLYELLAGRRPFEGSGVSILQRVIVEEPPALRSVRSGIPLDLETICQRAMAKEASRRYATAGAMAADLKAWLEHRPIRARRVGTLGRFALWCRRKPALAATIALAAVVSLTVASVSFWRVVEERNRFRAERDQKALALKQRERALQEKGDALAAAQASAERAQAETARALREERLARQRFYAAQINLAHQAWETGRTSRSLALLENLRPKFDQDDLRSFEWFYLWRLCHRNHRMTLRGHDYAAVTLAFTPDGQTLASGGLDRRVRLWDVRVGREVAKLSQHTAVWSLAYSPDGETLAVGLYDGTTKLAAWDGAAWQERGPLVGHTAAIRGIAFFPDGKTLATASYDSTIKLWDVAAGSQLASLDGHYGVVWSVAVSPDGRTIASGGFDRIVHLWEWDGTAARERPSPGKLTNEVRALAFSPDGATLAAAAFNGDIALWDMATGQQKVTRRGDMGEINSISFAPDGKILALGCSDKTVRLWDPATGKERTDAHLNKVWAVAFSPDGQSLASASARGEIKLWETKDPEQPAVLDNADAVSAMGLHPESRKLVAALRSGPAKVWDAATGQVLARLDVALPHAAAAPFSPDGTMIATPLADGSVKLWDSGSSAKELATLKGHSNIVYGAAFSPDGQTLATASMDTTVNLWDVSCRTLIRTLRGHSAWVTSVSFSPNGRTVAAGGQSGEIKLWDAATGNELRTLVGPAGIIWAVVFSADGNTLATTSYVGQVTIWDLTTGEKTAILNGHTAPVNSIAFFSDGKTLATASDDWSVKLWDVLTGQERITLMGHTNHVVSLGFDPKDNTLYTASADGTVRLWPMAADPEARAVQDELDPDDPESPFALRLLGEQHRRSGKIDEATAAFRRAADRLRQLIATFPDQAEYTRQLNLVQRSLSLAEQERQKIK
jgi:WD40 repeat protein